MGTKGDDQASSDTNRVISIHRASTHFALVTSTYEAIFETLPGENRGPLCGEGIMPNQRVRMNTREITRPKS